MRRLIAFTLAAILSGSSLLAATTLNGDLTADVTVNDELIIPSGAAIDLKGYNLTLNGKLTVQGAATITNSDTGDCKDVTLKCTNNLTDQFQNKLTFSGNLKLTVGGNCSNVGGFQGSNNTHTGGTVLDGYNTNGTARFTGSANFGPGNLTLKNGSRIYNTSKVDTVPWPNLYVSGGSTVTNRITSDAAISITGAVHAASGDILRMVVGKSIAQSWSGSMADMKGTMILDGGSNGGHVDFYNSVTLEYATLVLEGGTVRINKANQTDGTITIGSLLSPSGTSTTTGTLINTTDWSTLDLKVGALNTDTTFYGNLGNDYGKTKNRKDIKLEKVGTGTLTLGGENEYMGDTTLSAGAIKLIGSGRLGYTSNSNSVVFNGGELIFGADNTTDPSSRFKTATGCTAKVGVDDDCTHTLASIPANVADFEKTRNGTLILTSGLANTGSTTVSAGTLVVQPGASLGTGELSIADGAKILIDASSASWESGATVSLFTVGSLASGTTLSTDNIGLYGVSGKTAIDSITLDGTTVKATVTTKTLLWNGGNGTWDTTSANWVNKADATEALVYAEGDKVEFGGNSAYMVTISSDVTPSQLTLAPEEGGNVTFAGDGAINLAAFVKGGAGTVTLGNGKNPFTSIDVTAGTLALGADQPVSIDNASLYVEGDAVLDLNGHSLVVGYAGQRNQSGNSAIVTNSQDAVLGSLTVGTGNAWPDFNARATLGGYMNYIVTGYRQKHFRDSKSTLPTNTISGMVAMKDQSGDCRIYGAIDTGSADIGFLGNAKLYIPSSNLSGLDGFQGIHVEGENNRFKLEGYSGGTTIKFNGPLTGDGSLILENGFKPSIRLDGDTSDFEGTLYLKYSYDGSDTWRGIFFERANNLSTSDGTASLEKATVVMTNETSNACNKLWIAGGLYHGSIDTFPIGDLSTATSDFNTYTNSALYTYKDGVVLEVGALDKSSTFAASIREQERSSYHTSLVKVGAGTWTLTGTNHYYLGTTTVKGGRLNIDSAEFTAGTDIIVTNAVLGGTGTIKVPITVKKDGTLAGSFAATAGVTFEAGSIVEVAAGAANVPNISSAIDASALTVKLTGELNTANKYTILTAGSGSSGTASVEVDTPPSAGVWSTKWEGSTLKAYYVKPGFVITIADAKVTLDNDSGLTTWIASGNVDCSPDSAETNDYLATQNSKGISPLAAYMLGYETYSDSTEAPTMTASVTGDSFSLAYDLSGKTAHEVTGIVLSYSIESADNAAFTGSTTSSGTTLAFASAGTFNRLVANITTPTTND